MTRKALSKTINTVLIAAVSVCMFSGCSSKDNSIAVEESSIEMTEEDMEASEEMDKEQQIDPVLNNYVFTPLITEESIYGGANSENGGTSYTIRYQSAILDEQTAEVYPKLSETLIKDKDLQMKGSDESLEAFKETASFIMDNSAYAGMELTDEILTSVVRADHAVLSLKKEGYWFNAGAHGFYHTVGVNYDPESGERLKLNDVVNDTDQLIAAAGTKLNEAYPEGLSGIDRLAEIINTASDKVYGEEGFDSGFGWTIGYNQLELYFNPYTLGSYAEGQQIIKLNFSDYPELFNEKYTKNIPDAYLYKINSHEDIVYEDIDNDGKNEAVKISMLLDGNGLEYTDEYILEVSFEDKTYSTSFYSFQGYENYFVKDSDGSCYVYSFTQHDNDYVVLDICKITKEGLIVSNAGNLEPAVISYDYIDSEECEPGEYLTNFHSLGYALTNPRKLKLSSRLDALSTYNGYRNYTLNEDGFPVSDNPFIVDSGKVLKLKKDFELEECYQNGKRRGIKQVLPEGTELYIHLTDGLNYVVLRYETDKYVYAEIDVNEYPQLINGESSEDVLDGMFYAG